MFKRIILASSSPRRQKILKTLFENFEIVIPQIEEIHDDDAIHTVEKLALLKALNVFDKVKDAVVIGADTVVEIDGTILGKPKDLCDAESQLCKLLGKWHSVHTCVAVVSWGEMWLKTQTARVKFRKVPKEVVKYYAQNYSLGKAGSYGLQDFGGVFVESIVGDPYVVIGLPIADLWEYFYRKGWWSSETKRTDDEGWF
ncbi:Maf family nucleotide pyrophosphatase [Thermotoga profunda]|uniref:Maf family nucleotide pyrophosphatase n=1 Tax=Thermotoga profunda TaxID=1508420 RepID=UPI000694F7BD|nr:Maf family nucleotide pyrophosphatase [Thermotoga profunda]